MSKKIGVTITIIILVAGFLLSNLLSSQKPEIKKRSHTSQSQNYKITTIKNNQNELEFTLTGPVKSLNTIDLFSEVTGIYEVGRRDFREGNYFKKGDVLLKIKNNEFKNNVMAQKSSLLNQLTLLIPDMKIDFPESVEKWQQYLSNYKIEKPLKSLPKINNEKEKYYIASRNIFSQYFTIKSLEAKLDKYTIIAPFSGVVTETDLNPGTLVRGGQKLGRYSNTDVYEMVGFASLDVVKYLKVGIDVLLTSSDLDGVFSGKIDRINSIIDTKTQTVKVYITSNDKRLRDGLFMTANITVISDELLSKLPSVAVQKGNVWKVDNWNTATPQKVHIINSTDSHVIVSGLTNGIKIILNPNDKIYNGMKISSNAKNQNKKPNQDQI